MKNHIAGWVAATALFIPASADPKPTTIAPYSVEPTGFLALSENIMTTPEELLSGNYMVLKGLKYVDPSNVTYVCSQPGEPTGEYASKGEPGAFIAVHYDPKQEDYTYTYDIDADHSGIGQPVHLSARLTPFFVGANNWDTGAPEIVTMDSLHALRSLATQMLSDCNEMRARYSEQEKFEKMMSPMLRRITGMNPEDEIIITKGAYALQMVKEEPKPPAMDLKTLGLRGPQK